MNQQNGENKKLNIFMYYQRLGFLAACTDIMKMDFWTSENLNI